MCLSNEEAYNVLAPCWRIGLVHRASGEAFNNFEDVGLFAAANLLERPTKYIGLDMAEGVLILRLKLLRMFRRARRKGIVTMLSFGERMLALTTYRERRHAGWQLAGGAAMFALVLIAALFPSIGRVLTWITWIATPDGKADYLFWVGTKSIFDLVTGAMTTLIAIVAAYLALRSYRVNQRAAVANRFQKGVELIGAGADSSKLGGIELLSVVAREDHKEYQEPVIRTLRQFLQERCAGLANAVYTKGSVSDPATLPGTDFIVMAALSAVARTDPRRRWLELEHDDEGLTLRGVCLHKVRLVHYDFSRIRFVESVLGDISFESCTFAETFIDARCFGVMRFHNCSINNFDVLAADIDGDRLDDAEAFIKMFQNRRISRFRVNGQLVSTPT